MWKTIKLSISFLMLCFLLVSCVSDETDPSRPSVANYHIDQLKTFKIDYEDNQFLEKIVFHNFNSDSDLILYGDHKNVTLTAQGTVHNVGYVNEEDFKIDPAADNFWETIDFDDITEIDELEKKSEVFRFKNPSNSDSVIETGEKFVIFEFQPAYSNVLLLILMKIELIEKTEFRVKIKLLDKMNL